MAKIIWSELARDHLKEIDSYISTGSPFYSIIFIDNLIESIDKIGSFPKCGRIVPEFSNPELREFIYKNYRIVYRIKQESLEILTVFEAHRLVRIKK